MGGDVLDPLAIEVDLAVVAQRIEILRAVLRPRDLQRPDRLGLSGEGFLPRLQARFVRHHAASFKDLAGRDEKRLRP
jgi:hypothetical protein